MTDALRAQFACEVDSFDVASLAIELRRQNSMQGVPRFKVALTRPNAAVGQVLSEGEHRCVALLLSWRNHHREQIRHRLG